MIEKLKTYKGNYKTLIFDLDGTLNNTKEGIEFCFKKTLDEYGISYEGVDFNRHIGPPLEWSFKELVGGDNWQDALIAYRKNFVECNAVMMSKLYDGVEVMLKKLKESGRYAMCVASSKYEPAAIESLTRFNVIHYFDNVYAQNERRGFKNEILAQLISENGYDKQTCLMIGDTHYDIDGARENSLDVVGVTYGFESRQQIVESKPDAIVDSALELLDLLLD